MSRARRQKALSRRARARAGLRPAGSGGSGVSRPTRRWISAVPAMLSGMVTKAAMAARPRSAPCQPKLRARKSPRGKASVEAKPATRVTMTMAPRGAGAEATGEEREAGLVLGRRLGETDEQIGGDPERRVAGGEGRRWRGRRHRPAARSAGAWRRGRGRPAGPCGGRGSPPARGPGSGRRRAAGGRYGCRSPGRSAPSAARRRRS